jgi:outer membrane cobalamin receptor
LIDIAGRFEHYNDFGSNLAGKFAIRYKLSPAFSIRGSLSNGYHAPALQQIYLTSTSGPDGKISVALTFLSQQEFSITTAMLRKHLE